MKRTRKMLKSLLLAWPSVLLLLLALVFPVGAAHRDVDSTPSDTWVKESGIRIGPGGFGSPDINGAQTQDVVPFPAGASILNPDGSTTPAPADFIRMYYGGIDSAGNHQTLSAVSFDEGLTWTKEPGIRLSVIADEHVAYHPSVVPLAGGDFRMYFESIGGTFRIRSATSADGLTWTRDPGDRLTNAFDPEVIELPGGGFRMYFVRGANILSAVSADGISWTEEAGVRIAQGPPGALDAAEVSHHYVILLPDGRLRMYYTAADGVTPLVHASGLGRAILSAVSSDGLSWDKEPGIRLDLGAPGSLDAGGVFQPAVLQLSDGSFRMFYQGIIDPSQRFILSARAVPAVLEVSIDIKPGSFPNSINPKSKGKIPVAILTTDTFDATTVGPTTVLFGATGTEAAPVQSALEDVDGDGDTDMILHFNTQDTGIECGDTSASLTGETFSGQAIQGSDSVNTVGCK